MKKIPLHDLSTVLNYGKNHTLSSRLDQQMGLAASSLKVACWLLLAVSFQRSKDFILFTGACLTPAQEKKNADEKAFLDSVFCTNAICQTGHKFY